MYIQMVTALVLQLIQCVVHLPSVEKDSNSEEESNKKVRPFKEIWNCFIQECAYVFVLWLWSSPWSSVDVCVLHNNMMYWKWWFGWSCFHILYIQQMNFAIIFRWIKMSLLLTHMKQPWEQHKTSFPFSLRSKCYHTL